MSDYLEAARLNAERRPLRFAEGRAQGADYMLECRDLGDSEDRDAGVYFKFCSAHELASELAKMPDDDPWNRVLGIFNLALPLEQQGLGITRALWLTGRRIF